MTEIEQRVGVMFSGKNGCVQPSGKGAATTEITFGFARDVTSAIKRLPSNLFDKNVKVRPCGLLCKLGAGGMLACDMFGLPLTPWILAEPVGKALAKLAGELPGEIKKVRKAAARKGTDVEAAAAGVPRRVVDVTLPTARVDRAGSGGSLKWQLRSRRCLRCQQR